ncbi:Lrp/AsnC family transcriptional regulator [Undibacterium sp. Ji42W]|uniref:Lrp/AsnC family transcriptional regulator n=1 Tax=Undibacterium sp. Ji42W TaxID=3413039 RepID=UPI003BF42A24
MIPDGFDLAILRCLQNNARHSAELIGADIGLSTTAVQRRIRKLRDDGVIRAEVAIVNPQAVGYPLTVMVEVAFKKGLGDAIDSFRQDMQALTEVQQCFYLSGEFDFMLIVQATDMAAHERFARAVFSTNDHILKFQTTLVMDTVKQSYCLPI